MTSSQGGSKGFQQVDDHVKAEYQRDVNGFVGNGPGSQAGDEPITSKIGVNVQNERQVAVQGNAAVQVPQQQPQGSLVHWEQFLHVRSIKVMLVENDDCTRHIVTALLRNCNYEVIEAANGLQAWKILENLSVHIDIVLTEVVMPFLSGIGLLYKIMSHKSRKNAPVIMMSSHDSMGLVFKCLSKGAVDFLVKPIRKNELKILWQHVWRRCHSSSGSGSESGTQAQKSVNSKSNLRCNNGRIDGDDDGSTDDSSDDGSGTQSSWTKQGVEPESPEAASPCDQDSTCGLVIRPRRDFNDQEGQPCLDDGANAKETAIQISKNSEMQIEFPVEAPIKHNGTKQNIHQVLDPTLNVKTKDSKKHKAKDSKMSDPHMENVEIKGQEEPEKIINANTKVIADFNEVVVGETGLKRPRATENDERKLQNGCNILRHSELSAFTRYNTNSNVVKCTPGIAGSCSQPDNRTSLLKNESNHDAHSDGYLIYQGSSEQVTPRKADGTTPADALNQELHIQHIHHHHHVHHYHNIATDQQLLSKHDDFGLSKLAADAPYCGSSNIKGGGAIEGNLENNSVNRSGSGSKHGSNVPNGSNTGVNLEVTNVESNVGVAGISGSGDASGGGSRDHHKSAQREAALTKFRQKREARCFQKKVRYQNRKKLAEQRTRVRGQFVKGTNRDCSTTADDG